jgi:hypothetical protein
MRPIHRSALIGLLVVLAAAGESRGQTLDQIKQAWQQRQDSIKNMRVSWTEFFTEPKGYIDLVLRGQINAPNPKPPTDLRLPGRGTVTFDDHNLRLLLQRKKWSVKYEKVMDREQVNVYTGDKDVVLTTKPIIIDYPDAKIWKHAKPEEVGEYTYWPLTCYARGLNPTFAPLALDTFEVTGKTQTIDGRPCLELVKLSRSNNGRQVLLLDPGRDFLMVRYAIVMNDRVTLRLDVKYASDATWKWLPKTWDYAAVSPTGLRIGSRQVQLESCDINTDLAPETFDLQLPPGTRVYEEYDGPAKQYVIKDNGEPGRAIPDSASPTYEQLTALPPRASWLRSNTAIVMAGVTFLLAVLALTWRWRRSRVRRSPSPLL